MASAFQAWCAMPSPAELEVDITIQADVELPAVVTEEAVASFARQVLIAEGESGSWQFGIRFVDDETISRAHANFMGIDLPTDIMTFPYEDDGFDLVPEGGEILPLAGGDLVISLDRAADHAREVGWETSRELFFLICHGLLHILGWDDEADEDRSRMLDRQSSLLGEWLDSRERGAATP